MGDNKQRLVKLDLRTEFDVVFARQRARQLAVLLQFDQQDQVRIATAVSEVARNALKCPTGGRIEFYLGDEPPQLQILVTDKGPGRPSGCLAETDLNLAGMDVGSSKRLVDDFTMESTLQGTQVLMKKVIPNRNLPLPKNILHLVATELSRVAKGNPLDELRHQNEELLRTLDDLNARQEELALLNLELEETNRGVVALYSELDEKAESLRRANEIKTRFLSNMTHEFRTPLNSVLSLARLLLDRTDGDLSEEQEKQVRYIQKSIRELSEMVNDLLDIAKVEAGKVTVRPEEFEVCELLAALKGMFRPLLPADSEVELIFDEPKSFPKLYMDEGKVAQILRNFISNALNFTQRGEIRVSCDLLADEHVLFSVRDTGSGIAREDQDVIFEEFMQLDNLLQKSNRGTGLGLPLTRRLAELLGGEVGLESTLGIGSTFSVRLPLRYERAEHLIASQKQSTTPLLLNKDDDPQPNPTLHQADKPPNHLSHPLLVIDDNEITRYLLIDILEDEGYTTIEAKNGEEGLRMAKECPPSVIFLDLIMPSMTGFEVLAKLKRDPLTANIPVIIQTSKLLTESEAASLTQSAVTILSKEAFPRQVAASKIRQALELAKRHPPNKESCKVRINTL